MFDLQPTLEGELLRLRPLRPEEFDDLYAIASDSLIWEQHVIGSSRFHGYDADNSEIEIGWTFLARSRWGGAYNGEMKQLMLRHAFRFVKSVIFLVGPRNVRSQRAMEKIGGVRDGTRRDDGGRESLVYRTAAPRREFQT